MTSASRCNALMTLSVMPVLRSACAVFHLDGGPKLDNGRFGSTVAWNQVGHFLEPTGDGLASCFEEPRLLSPDPQGLSRIVFEESLDTNLHQVAALAVRNVPGADFAGITLLRDGRPTTAVFTD